MTKNNFKIALFSTLLLAMILPFSVMEFASADDDDDEDNSGPSITTHEEYVDDGYYVMPGGTYVKNEDHGIDNDKSIEENGDDGFDEEVLTTHNGKTIIDLDKYIQKNGMSSFSNSGSGSSNTNFPVADGYNTVLVKEEDDSMSYFRAVWDVPTAPVSYDGVDTIFTFNAMQPFGSGTNVIFQPVLQYGNNGPCPNNQEGAFWVYYPLIFVDENTFNIGNCTTVSVGDELKGYIYKSGSTWYVKTYINGSFDSSVSVGYSGLSDFSSVALETYGLTENCDSIPGDEEFSSIWISGDTVAWADLSSQGAGQWCGMTTNIVDSSTGGSGKVQLNNNN